MGGVAGAIRQLGHTVAGSEADLYEPMASYLHESGITVFSQFDPGHLERFKPDQVVVGNAVSRGNEELEWALEHRCTLVSLPQLVAEHLIAKRTSIVIAGTHGKTTTTAMTAWLLECGGLDPGYLIGAVPGNFAVSCRPGGRASSPFVIEGDEYDSAYWDKRSKFLHYRPDIAVINNLEFDHADIFDSLSDIQKSFRLLARMPPRNGLLLAQHNGANLSPVVNDPVCSLETFGTESDAGWSASIREASAIGSRFDVLRDGIHFGAFEMQMVGDHNVRNMLAAIAIGAHLGVKLEALQAGAASFLPPKRRMEPIGTWRGATLIDDFGHHPTAIRETLAALKLMHPGKRLIAVFEPRSNTTTRSLLQTEISEAFDAADAIGLGALNRPSRYAPHERLDVEGLVEGWRQQGKSAAFVPIEASDEPDWGRHLIRFLESETRSGDLVVLFSNGNIGGLRAMLATQEPGSP